MASQHGTRLTFVIETYRPWSDEGIDEIGTEFNRMYGGNLAIREAYLSSFEDYTYDDEEDDG